MGLNDFFPDVGGSNADDEDDYWNVAAHNRANKRDLAWLNETVAELEQVSTATNIQSILILTHWSPSTDAQTMDPRHVNSPITNGFAADLPGEA